MLSYKFNFLKLTNLEKGGVISARIRVYQQNRLVESKGINKSKDLIYLIVPLLDPESLASAVIL